MGRKDKEAKDIFRTLETSRQKEGKLQCLFKRFPHHFGLREKVQSQNLRKRDRKDGDWITLASKLIRTESFPLRKITPPQGKHYTIYLTIVL